MRVKVPIDDGEFLDAESLTGSASDVTNLEVDQNGVNRPRPGYISHSLTGLTSDPVIAMETWKDHVILVTEATSGVRSLWAIPITTPGYAMALSNSADSTTQLGGEDYPVFAHGYDYIYVTGGSNIVRWTPTSIYAETLSSSPLCTHVVAIGQRLVANTSASTGSYRWTDIGEGVFGTWPSANASDADARPDPIVGIFDNSREMFVFGSSTLQVYAVGNDPYLPFDQTSSLNLGLAAPYAACRLDEGMVFLDNQRRITVSDGRTAEQIDAPIRHEIRGFDTISDCRMWREERDHHSMLVVQFPTEERTFVYDLSMKRWTERASYVAPFQVGFSGVSYAYVPAYNLHLYADQTSGVYEFDDSVGYDQGSAPIVCTRTTGWTDGGEPGFKRSSRVTVVMRRGTGSATASVGSLELRVQNDDGAWGAWQSASIGTPDQYQREYHFFLGGIFQRRRYGIRYSNTDPTALVALYDDMESLEPKE